MVQLQVTKSFSGFFPLLHVFPQAFRHAWSTLLVYEPQYQCGGWRPCGGGGGDEGQATEEHGDRGHHGGTLGWLVGWFGWLCLHHQISQHPINQASYNYLKLENV